MYKQNAVCGQRLPNCIKLPSVVDETKYQHHIRWTPKRLGEVERLLERETDLILETILVDSGLIRVCNQTVTVAVIPVNS